MGKLHILRKHQPPQSFIHKPLHKIAAEIQDQWPKVSPQAQPHLTAMHALTRITDVYGLDTAESVVRYFLANAGAWRGPKARDIRFELREILDLLKNDDLAREARQNHENAYNAEADK